MLREIDARRPEWIDGLPVVFGDDQTWHLPRPAIGFRLPEMPEHGWPGGTGRPPETSTYFGSGFWELREAITSAKGGDALLIAVARMARDLLRRNYILADGEVDQLLIADLGDPEGCRWVNDVLNLVLGHRTPTTTLRWLTVCAFLSGTLKGPMLLEDAIAAGHWASLPVTIGLNGQPIYPSRSPRWNDWVELSTPMPEVDANDDIRAFGRMFGL